MFSLNALFKIFKFTSRSKYMISKKDAIDEHVNVNQKLRAHVKRQLKNKKHAIDWIDPHYQTYEAFEIHATPVWHVDYHFTWLIFPQSTVKMKW